MLQSAKKPSCDNVPITGELVHHDEGKEITQHSHEVAQFSVVLSGTMRIRSNGGWWLAPAGRGIWIPAGTEHSASYSDAATFVLLKISAGLVDQLFPGPCVIAVSDLLRELALEIGRTVAAEENALFARLVVNRIGMSATSPIMFLPVGRDPRLMRLMETLRRDPGRNDTLDDLARLAGSSRRTISRLFLAETGMSFAQWRDHLRVVTAVDLLVRGTSIIQVALALGFQNQSSFSNMFRRIVGMPPGRYLLELEENNRKR